jgi:hypothetical protein
MAAKEIHLRYLSMQAKVSQRSMEKKNPESLEKVFTAVGKMVYE